jgi:uncharacterized membrane protein
MRPRDIALGITGLFAAGIGFAGLIAGEEADGVLVAVFGVMLLLVPMGGLLARRGSAPRLEGDRLVIPGSRAKLRTLQAVVVGFTAIGVVMIVTGTVVTGAFVAVVFGGMSVISLFTTRGDLRIVLTPERLEWGRGVRPSWVAWDDVEGAAPFDIQHSWFLAIDAREGAVHIPSRQRWVTGLNRRLGYAEGQIGLEPFAVDPESLADVVMACAISPDARRRVATPVGLRWLSGEEDLQADPAVAEHHDVA